MTKRVDPVIKCIKEHTAQSGLSQNQLAVKAGITPQRLSNLMNGRGQIKPHEIKALSEALHVSIETVFEQLNC